MISVVELKKALVDVIRSKYGKSYKYYGIEVTEGYEKPSFFTQIVPVEMENVTTNFADSAYSFVITYFQKQIDEADALQKVSELREAFGLKVKVEDRYVSVTDFDYEFVGEKNNILQMSLNVSFKDGIKKEETHQVMKELGVKQRLEV